MNADKFRKVFPQNPTVLKTKNQQYKSAELETIRQVGSDVMTRWTVRTIDLHPSHQSKVLDDEIRNRIKKSFSEILTEEEAENTIQIIDTHYDWIEIVEGHEDDNKELKGIIESVSDNEEEKMDHIDAVIEDIYGMMMGATTEIVIPNNEIVQIID